MKEPSLVILAAGMGSRFGGLKQITPVDEYGHSIIDFSLYDAYRAGFRKVVFIIKDAIAEDFRNFIGKRMEKYFDVRYVYQELDCLPEGFTVPEGRVKPFGTGHAVLCAKDAIDGPFAVINADDFYGPSAFTRLYEFLTRGLPDNEHEMLAYILRNTVTENGYVARGVCSGENGLLTGVTERTHIEKRGDDAEFTEDGGATWEFLPGSTLVSMNCWGFGHAILEELEKRFPAWLGQNLPSNPLKCEYFLPSVVNACIEEGTAVVHLADCEEKWYGMTYKEDLPSVSAAIAAMRDKGIYTVDLLK